MPLGNPPDFGDASVIEPTDKFHSAVLMLLDGLEASLVARGETPERAQAIAACAYLIDSTGHRQSLIEHSPQWAAKVVEVDDMFAKAARDIAEEERSGSIPGG